MVEDAVHRIHLDTVNGNLKISALGKELSRPYPCLDRRRLRLRSPTHPHAQMHEIWDSFPRLKAKGGGVVAAEPGTPGYPALRAKGTKIPTGFGSHEPVLSIEGFAVLRYVSTLEHTGSILTRGSEHFYGNIPYAMTVTVTNGIRIRVFGFGPKPQ